MGLKSNVPLKFDGLEPVTFRIGLGSEWSKVFVGDIDIAIELLKKGKLIFATLLPDKLRNVFDSQTKMMLLAELSNDEYKRFIETAAEVICINPAGIKYIKSA